MKGWRVGGVEEVRRERKMYIFILFSHSFLKMGIYFFFLRILLEPLVMIDIDIKVAVFFIESALSLLSCPSLPPPLCLCLLSLVLK